MSSVLVLGMLTTLTYADSRFLVIGDWGGSAKPPYNKPQQIENAAGMAEVAADGIDFIVSLGDNFYLSGVHAVDSIRFDATFESVYNDSSLMKPWLTIAGNHDHHGKIKAQIEYSKVSPRWVYPSLYHSHVYGDVEIILLDTIELVGMNAVREAHLPGYFDQPPGPLSSTNANIQWDWLENKLRNSVADYLFVGGHFPVYSTGSHGPTKQLVSKLKPLLQKYGAHYMAGHDHMMTHIEEEGVNYFVSGAGHGCCSPNANLHSIPKGSFRWSTSEGKTGPVTAGFMSVMVDSKRAVCSFHDQTGQIIYTAPDIAPRKATE